jgi:hypothetical protein
LRDFGLGFRAADAVARDLLDAMANPRYAIE